MFEVVVDLRPWSTTFLGWETFTLDDIRHEQVLVPAGCVHGFQALTDEVDICYKHDAVYAPELEIAVAYDDPDLGISWPLADPVLSERDQRAPRIAEVLPRLGEWYGEEPPPGQVEITSLRQ